MTSRENAMAILRYQKYDAFPVVCFGYWKETLEKWAREKHITEEEAIGYGNYNDNNEADFSIMKRLGFDFNWTPRYGAGAWLYPAFEKTIIEEKSDGSRVVRDNKGLIVIEKPGIVSIPSVIGT